MPGGLLQGLAAPFIGRLYDRVGVRPLMIPGIIVVAISTGLLTWAAYQRFGPIAMAMLYVLFEVGIAFGITPLYTASLSSLPAHLYSHGSATLSTAQQLASAIGVAILVAVLTQQTNSKVAAGAPLVDATAHGATSAFLVATILAVVAVLLSFFIKQAKN
jgi:drug resistance MFS transporter, drug:H+ antiporter-2 (14 spanner) (DHA2) family protein